MTKEKKRARRLIYTIWAFVIIPFLLFVISFWGDLGQTLSYFWRFLYWLLVGRDQAMPALSLDTLRAIQIMLFTVAGGFFSSFLLWLLLMSFQALLPVEKLGEVFNTALHQLIYLSGRHGAAVFVRDGKILDPEDELDRRGPGVLVVNFNSALVLERELGRTSCLMMPIMVLSSFITWMTRKSPRPISRVAGPGVVFKASNERIRAQVDLRKQVRASKGKINAYTRDGIELGSVVFTVFTIGQQPDTIELAYSGDRRLENLRIITTRRVGRNLIEVATQDVKLDPDDLNAAHEYARIPNQRRDALRYHEVPPTRQEPEFDEKRVFNAVYAQARSPKEEVEPWTELPARVAADVYRKLMLGINYDELYDLHNLTPNSYPIPRFKQRFGSMVRNLGLLNFRIVFHRSLLPLKDGTYAEKDLFVSPSLPFTAPRLLRDRGIKMIVAGFSSPIPVAPEIYQQRLATWRSEWERETEYKRAEKDLAELRVRNHARAQALRSLSESLRQIFVDGESSDEVMALRVLQAMEGISADPKTRQLLPGETITLMNNLHAWLLPARYNVQGANSMELPHPTGNTPNEGEGGASQPPPGFVAPDPIPPPPRPPKPDKE